jgi:hypothetical protein
LYNGQSWNPKNSDRRRQLVVVLRNIKMGFKINGNYVVRGQFHQSFCTKRKCAGSHFLAPVVNLLRHSVQQNYNQLYHYKQLENTLNFYAVRPVLYASKISVNLQVQKLPVER